LKIWKKIKDFQGPARALLPPRCLRRLNLGAARFFGPSRASK